MQDDYGMLNKKYFEEVSSAPETEKATEMSAKRTLKETHTMQFRCKDNKGRGFYKFKKASRTDAKPRNKSKNTKRKRHSTRL